MKRGMVGIGVNNMELAILSDIHSNYVALDTCLKYALSQNISRFIFLGDYVGELAFYELIR
jgi:Predicted phosphoesterase